MPIKKQRFHGAEPITTNWNKRNFRNQNLLKMKAVFKIQKASAYGGWLIDHTTDIQEGLQWQPFTFTARKYIAQATLKFFGMEATDGRLNKVAEIAKGYFNEDGKPTLLIIEHSQLIKL